MSRQGFAVMILLLGCSSLASAQRDEPQSRGRAQDTDVTTERAPAAPSTRSVGNSPPLAVDDSYTTGFGESLTVTASAGLLSNDFDPDGDSIIVQSIEAPSFGTLNIATDGSFTYTPDPGASGAEELTYTISDGFETDQGVVTITVETNNPPVAVDDSYATGFGEVLSVPGNQGLLVNDVDPDGDSIIVQSIEAPAFGSLNISTDGSFTYTPDPGASGAEELTYTISDGFEIDQGVVTITVEANNPPLAVDDRYATDIGESLNVSAAAGLLSNDFDPDGDSINVQSIEAPSFGALNIATDGSFTYTPDPGFSGTETLTYNITDGFSSAQGEVRIAVPAVIFSDRFEP